MKTSFLLGRSLFGGYFLYNGIHHFREHKNMALYVSSKNVPEPGLAMIATGTALVSGGASILLGIKPKFGATALSGFLAGYRRLCMISGTWKSQRDDSRK